MIDWQCKLFNEFSVEELHEVLRLRQQVFIIEQQCLYEDIDNVDQTASHLLGRRKATGEQTQLCAYLRFFAPNIEETKISLGRVLIHPDFRNRSLGKLLMTTALNVIDSYHPSSTIEISAQSHLESFYTSFGFQRTSNQYDEDGILHIDMIKL